MLAPFNNPLVQFISDRKFRWLRHTIFISLGLILAFKGDIGIAGRYPSEEIRRTTLLIDASVFIFITGMIYFLVLVLVPKLLFRSRLLLFSLSFIIIVILIYLFVWFVDANYLKPRDPGGAHIELSFLAFIQIGAVASVLLAAVVGVKIFQKWINDVKRMNELQEVNLRTELEQLKSQVNPHFLFNTLNNLLVLTKTDPEKATQVLLGLSDLLRYQLYDSAKEKILLTKDIDFISNLLALEKIRKTDFECSIQVKGNIDNVNLPPFLFIPFIENAIKHGASTVGHSYLSINFIVADKLLHFTSENSKPPVKKNGIGGLGLKNIKRRLELLYPGNHTLEITDNADKYITNLIIPI